MWAGPAYGPFESSHHTAKMLIFRYGRVVCPYGYEERLTGVGQRNPVGYSISTAIRRYQCEGDSLRKDATEAHARAPGNVCGKRGVSLLPCKNNEVANTDKVKKRFGRYCDRPQPLPKCIAKLAGGVFENG